MASGNLKIIFIELKQSHWKIYTSKSFNSFCIIQLLSNICPLLFSFLNKRLITMMIFKQLSIVKSLNYDREKCYYIVFTVSARGDLDAVKSIGTPCMHWQNMPRAIWSVRIGHLASNGEQKCSLEKSTFYKYTNDYSFTQHC